MSSLSISPLESSSHGVLHLTLGGGGARGLAHIIVLEVLDELGLRPSCISGASIGAIMGACYASGMSGQTIRSFFLDLSKKRTTLLAALSSARVGRFKDVASFSNPFLFDGEKLLSAFWPAEVPEYFEDLRIPLIVVAADFYGSQSCSFTSGPLLPHVAASMTIPGVFQPVSIQGRFFIDGGTLNPLPFDVFDQGKRVPVIAVDVTGTPTAPEPQQQPPSGLQILSGSIQLLQGEIIKEKLKYCEPDILVRPPINGFTIMDFLKIEQILEICTPLKDDLKHRIEKLMR